jgi:hypothetical protein
LPSSLVDSFTPDTWQNILLCAVLAACVMLALLRRGLADRFVRTLERILSAFAQRKASAIVAIFFAVLVVRLAVLRSLPIPYPGIHDEFSYLLLGDTFAHGRLTNPTHPMWRSFETFHVNWLPTYSSIYPPAQGAVLAVGQLLGNAWFGVLVTNAVMCAAILWMLQGWMPARWALLGTILAALKLGVASYWMNSYWGGAVSAIGGALVLGALPRIRKHGRLRDALLLAVGVAILANSRPYEGLLVCLPVAVWLIWWLFREPSSKVSSPPSRAARLRRVFTPIAVVLALTAAFMAFYNSRVTGHALLFPYTLNLRTTSPPRFFSGNTPSPPCTTTINNSKTFTTTGSATITKTPPPMSTRYHWKNGSASVPYSFGPLQRCCCPALSSSSATNACVSSSPFFSSPPQAYSRWCGPIHIMLRRSPA